MFFLLNIPSNAEIKIAYFDLDTILSNTNVSKKLFTNIFECGEAGLNDPKGTLKIATNNLIKELT